MRNEKQAAISGEGMFSPGFLYENQDLLSKFRWRRKLHGKLIKT
jgi:hypothetical protein